MVCNICGLEKREMPPEEKQQRLLALKEILKDLISDAEDTHRKFARPINSNRTAMSIGLANAIKVWPRFLGARQPIQILLNEVSGAITASNKIITGLKTLQKRTEKDLESAEREIVN